MKRNHDLLPFFISEEMWITKNNSVYYINRDLLPFAEADDFCKDRIHGNLVLMTSPKQYVRLGEMLNLESGVYWIGGKELKTIYVLFVCLFVRSFKSSVALSK